MSWKLQAQTSELNALEILIDRDLWVGRHQTADLVLQAAEISRKHAAFLLKDDVLLVQDLGSSNGTFVNDVQVTEPTPLKHDDQVKFASLLFKVVKEESSEADSVGRDQVETQEIVNEQLNVAQQMNDQGMPELKERDASVQLTRDGMPTNVGIPKPAPIPEGIDITAVQPEPTPVPIEQPVSRVEEEKEAQKNASVGLISVVVLIILAILAWLLFK